MSNNLENNSDNLLAQFKELRTYIEDSSMEEEEKLKAKVMLNDIRRTVLDYTQDVEEKVASKIRTNIEEIEKEKSEVLRKSFMDAYKELKDKYTQIEEDYTSLLRHNNYLQATKIEESSMVRTLENTAKELQEKLTRLAESNVVTEEQMKLIDHANKFSGGKLSFKDNVDINLVIELYKSGYSAGKIVKEMGDRGIKVSRQTIINRLFRIGLWGNRETWSTSTLTQEQKDYIEKHGLDIK